MNGKILLALAMLLFPYGGGAYCASAETAVTPPGCAEGTCIGEIPETGDGNNVAGSGDGMPCIGGECADGEKNAPTGFFGLGELSGIGILAAFAATIMLAYLFYRRLLFRE